MSSEVLDLQEALERVQDDKELLLELFDIFQEDYIEKRKILDEKSKENNFEDLKNIAHSLKGASSNISAKKVYASFSQLEIIAPEGEVEKINGLLGKIDVEYEELSKCIVKLKEELK